ncbi:MAG: YjjG family noncanonical pyrimidine nucleotidase, partial [Anaerolineales bacterium]|nr:YjjG family noncanonical pyrimidine nucleotidase [Anaerolineales bacterium]
MTYQWLLFDADNTLFDYDQAETAALTHTFADFRLDFTPETAVRYRDLNAAIWREFEAGQITQADLRAERFRRLFAAAGIAADPTTFSHAYLGHLARGAFLVAGAVELLQALNGRFHLALITNGLSEVQRPRLAASPLRDAFGPIIVSEEVGAAKPHPAIFDAAFAAMGHPPREAVLIVGDSLSSDMQGGVNYGIDTCWFNPAG